MPGPSSLAMASLRGNLDIFRRAALGCLATAPGGRRPDPADHRRFAAMKVSQAAHCRRLLAQVGPEGDAMAARYHFRYGGLFGEGLDRHLSPGRTLLAEHDGDGLLVCWAGPGLVRLRGRGPFASAGVPIAELGDVDLRDPAGPPLVVSHRGSELVIRRHSRGRGASDYSFTAPADWKLAMAKAPAGKAVA